jgi:class 3 adenylate cyclase
MTPMSVEQLLALHPWPAEYAKAPRLDFLWTFDLPGQPETLWPFIADTSRMNRAIGVAEMRFEEREGKRWGTSRNGGVTHEWVEVPWNWVANQWLTCTRIYTRGFTKVMYAIHRLEKIATGTRLYLYFGAIPSGVLGRLALKLGFPSLERAYRRVLPELAKQLDRPRPDILVQAPPTLTEDADARLRGQRELLVGSGLPEKIVDRLIDWVRTGDDTDLHRIQIRERARVWNVDEQELLRVALHATRAGVLALSWDTVCPHCRGVREETEELGDLPAESRCDACQVTFGTDGPEAVEVTFRVHPSIRDIPERLYCSAEPAMKDHIRVQRALVPGEEVALAPELDPGRYRVRAGKRPGWFLDVLAPHDAGGAPSKIRWAAHPAETVIKAAPGAAVELVNDAAEPEIFAIERATWSDHALRPGHLLSFQEFRDLFSESYIGADVRLAVGEQTLLFTDVVGSTAFYASRGDPAAFVEIKRHFDEIFERVRENRGAVVKTIGDAVMAAFVSPLDAVKAARQIHDLFHPTRDDTPIRVRISLNTGPCIAVRLNSNADFFGGTVNIAAKLQALAEGYQIALSEATYRAPGVAAYLAAEHATLEDLTYTSKALPEPVAVKRWTVHAEVP